MGISAIASNGDFDDAVNRSSDPALTRSEREQARQDGLDAEDRTRRRTITADVLGITALLGAGTALFLWARKKKAERGSEESSWNAAPVASPRGASLVIEGRF